MIFFNKNKDFFAKLMEFSAKLKGFVAKLKIWAKKFTPVGSQTLKKQAWFISVTVLPDQKPLMTQFYLLLAESPL